MPSNTTNPVIEPYKILSDLNAQQRRVLYMYGAMGSWSDMWEGKHVGPDTWFNPQGKWFEEKPSRNTIKALVRRGLLEKRSWVRVRFTDLGRDTYRLLFWEIYSTDRFRSLIHMSTVK